MTKIAIIEDDIAIVQMYLMKFESEGFEVYTAGDGEQGLTLIKDKKPDIVLLDLMMPVMRGDEMLSQLRAEDWGKDVPVIVLTNMGESEAPDSIKKNGVSGFIVKAHMTPKEVANLVKEKLNIT
ncbi:TPA: response regulator [Candidatus Saccharibacteria bacterium]|nr:response regulator [Candidatus Saccharibacteria bacterium]HIO88030.1 response regulator [Candidatus Saccharibacteria bacterium]